MGIARGDKAAPTRPTWARTWIARWNTSDGSSTHQRYYANETYARKFVKNRADAGLDTALYVADTQWTDAGAPPPITSRKNRRKTEDPTEGTGPMMWAVVWCEEPDDGPQWYGGTQWGADEREEELRERGVHYLKAFTYRQPSRVLEEIELAAGTLPRPPCGHHYRPS